MKEPTVGQACQDYLEDPEAHSEHLETCAECRAIEAALGANAEVPAAPISLEKLPVAPWEGASHRAWPVVLGAFVVVIAIALLLCNAAGISLQNVVTTSLASMDARRGLLRNASDWLRAAPMMMQVAFGVAFIIVNALLVLLLRRSPRGIDA